MAGHKLHIEGSGPVCKDYRIWIDDFELTGCNSLKLDMVVGEAIWATFRILVNEVEAKPPIGPYSILTPNEERP